MDFVIIFSSVYSSYMNFGMRVLEGLEERLNDRRCKESVPLPNDERPGKRLSETFLYFHVMWCIAVHFLSWLLTSDVFVNCRGRIIRVSVTGRGPETVLLF